MARYLEFMLAKAFETIPGELYNQYRSDVAAEIKEQYLFYEISLMEEKSWEYLRDWVYPNFTRYIKAKQRNPTMAERVVVAIFHGNSCYLLQGKDFLGAFQQLEGLDAMAFAAQVRQWLDI
ncbi:MAG: hypothetical protein JRJ12_05840 [Deltaproteobacteria bacterium]|nr:hypothetical protein [Deltaproteobacteria bacterium]MBW2070661.1 hypothetical protein [Deltaproteobacteria bacterium]